MIGGLTVSDAHAHASTIGLGAARIASKFKEAGGWFISFVSLPPHYYGLTHSFEDIRRSIDIHVRQCNEARRAGIRVACIAGIHPAVIDKLVRLLGPSKYDYLRRGILNIIDYIVRLKVRGLIDGYGEFGRPHYKTLPTSIVFNEMVMFKMLEVLRDYGGVLHLHLEQGGNITVDSINTVSQILKAPKAKVILHHSTAAMAIRADKHHMSSTIVGRKDGLKELVINRKHKPELVLVESDFIDDPKRPGAVMYPWEIANEATSLISEYREAEESLYRIMVDNVSKVYGVDPY
ncbi:MAG: hydrolase TatD [Thermoprotei archaeon]|nr:MAG: hydrolase TatD [Thermoprotei archaeon]